jgi:hypothetical protein
VRVKTLLTVAIFTVIVAALAVPLPPHVVDSAYSTRFYPALQRVLTSFSNLVPFALLDVVIVGFPVVWCALVVRAVARSGRRLREGGRWVLRTAVAAAVLYLIFLATWGLNYRRLPLEKKLKYDAAGVTADAARDAAQLAASQLNALYAAAHAAPEIAAGEIDPSLAAAFSRAMQALGASAATVPARPKRTLLDLYFRPAAVAGMTDPFFLETLVESDLLAVERPLVVAHEWSHLAGFADEGEANFAGWLTCRLGNAPAQYSGWLFLFGELVNSLPRSQRAGVAATLADGPRADLRAIAARLARDVSPKVSAAGWRVYDQYLKANRIEAGTASYAQVVRLVLGTRLGLTPGGSPLPAR